MYHQRKGGSSGGTMAIHRHIFGSSSMISVTAVVLECGLWQFPVQWILNSWNSLQWQKTGIWLLPTSLWAKWDLTTGGALSRRHWLVGRFLVSYGKVETELAPGISRRPKSWEWTLFVSRLPECMNWITISGCHVEVFIGKTQETVKVLEMKLGLDLTSPTEKSSKL